jgi:hypothetical protein
MWLRSNMETNWTPNPWENGIEWAPKCNKGHYVRVLMWRRLYHQVDKKCTTWRGWSIYLSEGALHAIYGNGKKIQLVEGEKPMLNAWKSRSSGDPYPLLKVFIHGNSCSLVKTYKTRSCSSDVNCWIRIQCKKYELKPFLEKWLPGEV